MRGNQAKEKEEVDRAKAAPWGCGGLGNGQSMGRGGERVCLKGLRCSMSLRVT